MIAKTRIAARPLTIPVSVLSAVRMQSAATAIDALEDTTALSVLTAVSVVAVGPMCDRSALAETYPVSVLSPMTVVGGGVFVSEAEEAVNPVNVLTAVRVTAAGGV